MSTETEQRRREELAAFLRSRRARVDRAALHLPPVARSRVPGLRREEVAALAGVSSTWYTWLEQARPINPSRSVLEAIARLFGLSASESDYLLRLGGHTGIPLTAEGSTVPVHLQRLLESVSGPAFLLASNWSIVAWNAAYERLYTRVSTLEPEERNLLWLVFTDAALRELMPDWHTQSRRFAGEFRASAGPAIGTAELSDLVRRLSAASPEFAEVWAERDVETFASRERVFDHPVDGRVVYEEHKLLPVDAPGHQLVWYLETAAERRGERGDGAAR